MGYPRTVPPKFNPALKSQSHSRLDPLASSPNLRDPTLRVNSFLKFTDLFCQLFLPALFYWPEAGHLGDLLQLRIWMEVKINLSLGFSRAFISAPDTRKSVVLYRPLNHISWQSDSMVSGREQEKRTLPRVLVDVSEFSCVTTKLDQTAQNIWIKRSRISTFWFGNIDTIPFR